MARRPPQRVQPRQDDNPAQVSASVFAREPAPTANGRDDAPMSSAPAEAPNLPLNRREFVETLGELRVQGSLDVADEAAILRQYDVLVADLKVEKTRLEVEFRERTRREGQDAARTWLSEAAEALGRREGARMRQLFQTIPALSQASTPA